MTGPANETTPRSRRLIGGYLASAAIGLLLIYPLLMSELLTRQLVGSALGAPWAPFGDDREGKTQLGVLVVLFVVAPLLLGALAISRGVRRRLGPGRATAAVHYLASVALVLLPYWLFRVAGWQI
ncbi:hypothetical protein [Kribbella sp. CA-247076]|uniref:hypothetical protein n=1 Tax=Kribbella sp. CA-247076 TaxID=3239941 RepID=UPI003D929BF8